MESDNLIQIKWFNNQDADKNICLNLRRLVFIDEQKFALELDLDENDSVDNLKTMNILLYYDKTPVGTTRLVFKDSKWYLTRVCILKDFRGKKLGNFLMEEIFKKSGELKIEILYVGSQVYAKEFYQKHGFIEFGDVYYDEHVQHIMMSKKLKPLS